jgi:hypothetical protein
MNNFGTRQTAAAFFHDFPSGWACVKVSRKQFEKFVDASAPDDRE